MNFLLAVGRTVLFAARWVDLILLAFSSKWRGGSRVRLWWRLLTNRRQRLYYRAAHRRHVKQQWPTFIPHFIRASNGVGTERLALDLFGDLFFKTPKPTRFRCGHVVPKALVRAHPALQENGILFPSTWCRKCQRPAGL